MQLRLNGLTWRGLARHIGVSPQAIQQTAGGRPSLPIEEVLATAIGVNAKALFPEHWAPNGTRIPKGRPHLRRAQDTSARPGSHAQNSRVA